MCMGDSKNLEDTLLFKLSKQEGLAWFRHVVLFSSQQDQYAPYESARVQISKKAKQETARGSGYI